MSSASRVGSVLVIGGGANGMASAFELARSGYRVELWRRSDGSRTASTVAPAFWYPFRAGPRERVDRWAADSLARYRELSRMPESGVAARRVREFVRSGTPRHSWSAIADDFREQPLGASTISALGRARGLQQPTPAHATRQHPRDSELRSDTSADSDAIEFSFGTFLVDTSRYMPWLERSLSARGVAIIEREVHDLNEVRGDWNAIVVAAGLGSRELAGDAALSGLRGQLVRIDGIHGADIILDERDDAAMAYVVPRHADTILGATLEARESFEVDEETTRALVARCARLIPSIATATVLDSRVGLRPLRPEVRVERGGRHGRSELVFNYGHGGSGVTLSWGCALEVTRLVNEACSAEG